MFVDIPILYNSIEAEIHISGISLHENIMQKSHFEFDVLVHGSSAKEYYHNGSYYVEGKEGTRFSLRMRNNSSHRVLFVPTVDGLSIMSGKEASFKSRGYIVGAYDSLTISGWRTSDNNVAEFFFSSPKESYATKINRSGNLGVIGCAVFKENKPVEVIEKVIKEYIPYPAYPHKCICNSLACICGKHNPSINTLMFNSVPGMKADVLSMSSASSLNVNSSKSAAVQGLGTGFGKEKYSPVVTVEFEKESAPTETFSIFYNTRDNLEKMGIEFRKPVYVTPSAFPKEEGYCERPKN